REFSHDLQFQKAHVEMFLGLRSSMAAGQDADDEVLVDALACLLSPYAAQRPALRRAASVRQMARVEEAILAHPDENLGIDALAVLAGCSVFHLCRTFRSMTGQSLRRYRMRHRIGTALARLGEGEDDLAALACDLGFSSHSHMTDAFREWLGVTPSEVRDDLRRSNLRALQVRLRAGITTRSVRGS
ncbi:MAG: AraC family transcriptional regulator, partial [Luteimonas sp.]